ncbi:MAG: HesA/MoeB/ThiF family protein [Succinatimonas hippei]|nr:HesA/MoeB/ThiF family protein [Succinatimonas hippei]
MRYERPRLLEGYDRLDGILEKKHVAVIGAGGLGGLCTYLLAAAGLKNITIADDDTVEDSNLHRQVMFNYDDIGRVKAECLKREILKLDPSVNVRVFEKRVVEENFADFVNGADLVMDLTDNVATRLLSSKMCLKLHKDFIHASVAAGEGIYCAFRFSDPEFVKEHGCYACFAGADAKPQFRGITGPYAEQISAEAAQLAMECFIGKPVWGQLWVHDMEKRVIRHFRLIRDKGCAVCSHEI